MKKDVYLFSGFLGSGKTSTLMDVIAQWKKENVKPAIFMNEIGKLSFDSQQLGTDTTLKEVLDGCICCSGAELVEAQLQQLLEMENFDVLAIETTGAAHPVEALDAVYSPLFANQLNVKGIVTIVDSPLLLNLDVLSPTAKMLFFEQIKHAHLLIANKMDSISPMNQMRVVQTLQNINSHAQIIQTSNGKVSIKELAKISSDYHGGKVEKVVVGEKWPLQSKFFTFSNSVNQEQFENWIKQLPDTVYRMKGYVPLNGSNYPFVFQYAYGMVQWVPEYVKVPTGIVVIGENLTNLSLYEGLIQS